MSPPRPLLWSTSLTKHSTALASLSMPQFFYNPLSRCIGLTRKTLFLLFQMHTNSWKHLDDWKRKLMIAVTDMKLQVPARELNAVVNVLSGVLFGTIERRITLDDKVCVGYLHQGHVNESFCLCGTG